MSHPARFLVLIILPLTLLAGIAAAGPAELQTHIDAAGGGWTAGETSISKMPADERRKLLGLIKPDPSELQSITPLAVPKVAALPTALDWRNHQGNWVTPVRSQGQCGSCWAFAATAALEAAVIRAQNTPGINLNLAEQVLVSCGGDNVGTFVGDCGGGYVNRASDFVRDIGLPQETCYPYFAQNGVCGNACTDWQLTATRIDSWHYIATSSASVDALKNALYLYGPLVTTMDVYTDFYNYSSGVYKHVTGVEEGGHAVLLVGYDDLGQYFIVKNSWGGGWGESGYFKIAYSEVSSVVEFGDYTIAYEIIADIAISNGTPISRNLSGNAGVWNFFYFDVPAGASELIVDLRALSGGNADIYLKAGEKPSLGSYDCSGVLTGTANEQCVIANPSAGTWWIGVTKANSNIITYTVEANWGLAADTRDKVGIFRNGDWHLDHVGNGTWDASKDMAFGMTGDIPVYGDWDGDGFTDIGVFNAGQWTLDSNGNGIIDAGDLTFVFGTSSHKPVTGDWDGDGITDIGVFRDGNWILDTNGNHQQDESDARYKFGIAGDRAVTGDWSGDGRTRIGVVRQGLWILDSNGNGVREKGIDRTAFYFGLATDKPVTGDWNGDGITDVGVFRSGKWILDTNGDGIRNQGDTVFTFGKPGDRPVVGRW